MSSDTLIFLIVVGLRLGVPLLILRYPLPAILAALVIDAADQTIFQNNTDLNLDGYQGYDKALDVYYLAIAYLSTFRNWADPFAARVAQALWYYRLVGVVAFELSGERALLLIFPNTFEYFFIAYEVVRLAWDPSRLSKRAVIGLAAFIWIFVKLPQEWWIHIAQLDFTDFMKEDVFGVPVDTSWGEAIGENLWFVGLLAVLAVGVALLARWALHTAPPPDWPVSVDVDDHPQSTRVDSTPETPRTLEWDLLEKALLASLISIIFSQVLPDLDSSPLQVTWTTTVFVVAMSLAAIGLSRFGVSWTSTLGQFVGTLAVGAGLVVLYLWLLRRSDEPINEAAAVFFVVLLSLIIALFDRFRIQGEERRASLEPFTPSDAPPDPVDRAPR